MCGSIPPSTMATLPSTVAGATGSGAGAAPNAAAAATTTTAMPAATTTTGTTTAGGPDASKLPIKGGGAADGAAQLQLQQTLSSLVQALTALTELLRNMPKTDVAGAMGSGPGQKGATGTLIAGAQGGGATQKPVQMPTQTPVQGGGKSCDTLPMPNSGGGAIGFHPATNGAAHAHSGGTTHAH